MGGIIESVRKGGVRPDTHFPNVLDGCYSYLPQRYKTEHKKTVATTKISCERRTFPLQADSIM